MRRLVATIVLILAAARPLVAQTPPYLAWDVPTADPVNGTAQKYGIYQDGVKVGEVSGAWWPIVLGPAWGVTAIYGNGLESAVALPMSQACPASPEETRIPLASSISDGACHTWTLGTVVRVAPNNLDVLRNGVSTGYGTAVKWVGGVVYARGEDGRWYAWPSAGSMCCWVFATSTEPGTLSGPPLTITCPSSATFASPDGNAVQAQFLLATSGGVAPVLVTVTAPFMGATSYPAGTMVTIAFPVGLNTVSETAMDANGQSLACAFTATVTYNPPPATDTLPPTITDGSFTVTRQNANAYKIHVAATDNIGVARIDIRVNGVTRKTCTAVAVCDYNPTKVVRRGDIIGAWAADSAGNATLVTKVAP